MMLDENQHIEEEIKEEDVRKRKMPFPKAHRLLINHNTFSESVITYDRKQPSSFFSLDDIEENVNTIVYNDSFGSLELLSSLSSGSP